MELININIDYLKTVNYVLSHNRIPVCRSIDIMNVSDVTLSEIKVICCGDFINKTESPLLAQLKSEEKIRISSFDVLPDITKLSSLTERIISNFTLTVTSFDEIIYENRFEIEFMPYDYWLGTTILPQTLASFITPNSPIINSLIIEVAAALKDKTGTSSLNAYQSSNINEVKQQVAAVFKTIHEKGLVYRSMPASYEVVGQRITIPEIVLTNKIANCIEVTLLMASILEAIGINSIVILQKGHAYLGVWLVDDCYSCSVCDDASFIEKKCSFGIREMLVIECTQMLQEYASFEDAIKLAEQNLANHSLFEIFIDIKRCRLECILPLAQRIQIGDTWTFDTPGVEHNQCITDVKEHDRYDLSQFANSKRELTKFDIWERKLLDFSLRNSLLNLNIRRKAIQFISFDIDKIEDHLQDGEEYSILPKPNVEFAVETTERLIRSKLQISLQELIRNDLKHHYLHSFLSEGETYAILKNIYRGARNAIEETGANSLFLAIGTLRWFQTSSSEVPRYAPILLLPVEMVYKKGKYYIRTREEEIMLNITLIEFLEQNYEIKINGLSPLPKDSNGVDVSLIFAILRDALKEQKRWDVEEECLLGTFSFNKFLMWNDIHSNKEKLRENNIVNSLVENRLIWNVKPLTLDLKNIDKNISPANIALPVPADSSQMAAVLEGGKGSSFILYGPPGTGKSQTITNLIANALYQGKRVLFVAEKMAALSVVQNRLEKIGLAPFCLELHSNKASKRHILQQLEKSLQVSHILSSAEFKNTAERIFEERKDLITYMNALHEKDSIDGLSLFECILGYESINAATLAEFTFDSKINELLSIGGIKSIEELLGTQFEAVIKLIGQPSSHPLNGFSLSREMLLDAECLVKEMHNSMTFIGNTLKRFDELSLTKKIKETLLRDNSIEILKEDAAELQKSWKSANSKWFLLRFFEKRRFIARIKNYNKSIKESDIDNLLENLSSYAYKHDEIERLRQIVKHYFNEELPEDEVPKSAILEKYANIIKRWANHAMNMRDWLHWCEYSEMLKKNGLKSVVNAISLQEYHPSELRDSYLKALFRYKAEEKIRQSEILVTFEGMLFDEKVISYKRLTEEFQILTQKELYARLAARIPRVIDGIDSSSEIGLLNRNISNGGRGLSLRDLFDQIPTLMPRLCPCMLMSPMSVAQYLDINQEAFDLVVFDEASQMPTCEAIGAIARGKSLIVVGDPKQMPPTSFFSSANVDAEEVAIDDMESILEDCRTLDIPSLQLSWHYRSRHESLIAFSNNEYYDGSLITFPSVDDQKTKVHYVPVVGFYDKGGKRCNKAEAEAIVKEIARRLKDEELRTKSIGVIAFSVVQQSLIEDLLQELLDKNKSLHNIAEQMYEPIFVKNLENVQGDERDIILFSIGYGPDKEGKVSMNFGPLNNAGGERRLNVAVSRARQEMYIYSTLKSSDIDLRRSKARGVEGLKHFLEYAETKLLTSSSYVNGYTHDEILAEQIAKELSQRGYSVTTNIGRSQFKVNVAVGDKDSPGIYRLGILIDGEGYSKTHTTRDREIVQPAVLSALHWQIMRVWSVDWFCNKERVLNRIEERLLSESPNDSDRGLKTFEISDENLEDNISAAKEYKPYICSRLEALQMSDKDLMRNIIQTEQPIIFIHLCRRVCALRELGRVTPTIQKAFKEYIPLFYEDKNKTLWITKEDSINYPYYRPNSGRDILDIPQTELINVLCEALVEQLALNVDNLILVAAKKLGFTRRGSNVEAAFKNTIKILEDENKIEYVGERIRLRSK